MRTIPLFLMQSGFKNAPPPFLEDIKRSLRVLVQEAEQKTLKTAQDLFGTGNVRFLWRWHSRCLSDGETGTDTAVDQLLDWDSAQ